MNLLLLAPAALAALAALLVPLLVHLARRSERSPTPFAALAWLTPRARPRRRLRFDEVPLLIVRLLLVAAVVLLLARPATTSAPAATSWVVAWPGVARAALAAEPAAADAERRWLAPGFPALDTPIPDHGQPTASLLRELDAILAPGVALTVLVPATLDGADGERPRLSRPVSWRVLPDARAPAASGAVAAHRPPAMPTLVIRHAVERAGAMRYLHAAALGWQASDAEAARGAGLARPAVPPAAGVRPSDSPGPATTPAADVGPLDEAIPDGARLLAWLGPGTLPDPVVRWVASGGTLLLDVEARLPTPAAAGVPAWRDDEGRVLLEERRIGAGRVLQWTTALEPPALPVLLDPRFPTWLRAAIEPHAPPPTRADATHYRPLTGVPAWPLRPVELSGWLVLLVAGLFVLERWLAAAPRSGESRRKDGEQAGRGQAGAGDGRAATGQPGPAPVSTAGADT